jgi:hypothetical protein
LTQTDGLFAHQDPLMILAFFISRVPVELHNTRTCEFAANGPENLLTAID